MFIMTLGLITNEVGTFFQLNGKAILRGYGGLKSEVQNFRNAIEAGCRFFDGAYAYKDGEKISKALAGRDVKQFVLSSKIPGFKLDKKDLRGSTERCFQEILGRRGVDEIDILYLHSPDCIHPDVMDQLVELREQGKIQYIGLCNVSKRVVEALVKVGYPIGVVQNEVNPYYWDKEILEFCQGEKIPVVGYRPFGDKQRTEIFEHEVIKRIAERVNGAVQDVILQWMNQKGVTPIAHSNSVAHIQSNLEIPEWKLSRAEMEEIDKIQEGKSSTCNWQKCSDQDLLAQSEKWVSDL